LFLNTAFYDFALTAPTSEECGKIRLFNNRTSCRLRESRQSPGLSSPEDLTLPEGDFYSFSK
jgi:hypothetical protein